MKMALRKIGSRTIIVLHSLLKYRKVGRPGISHWSFWTNIIQEPLNYNSKLLFTQNSHLNRPWNRLWFSFQPLDFQIPPLRIDGCIRELLVFVPSNWHFEEKVSSDKMKFPSAGPDSHPGTSVVFLEGGFHHWFYYFMVLYCTGFTFPHPPSPRSSISLLVSFDHLPCQSCSHSQLGQAGPVFLGFILF